MRDDQGYVLVLSLIMLVVLMILASGVASLLSSEVSFVSREEKGTQTFYLAEAGIEYASTLIMDENKWDEGNLIEEELNKASDISDKAFISNISKEIDDDTLTITSRAKSNDDRIIRVITAEYLLEQFVSDAFKYSLVANGNIDLKNKVEIIGNEDGGDVYTTGVVETNNKTTLTDSDIVDSAGDSELDSITPPLYEDIMSKKDSGGLTFFSERDDIGDNNIVFLDGNQDFKNGTEISGNGILVVDGDIDFKQGSNISTGENENLIILASGSITLKNSSQFNGLIYAKEKVNIKAKVDIKGTIISDKIEDNTTMTVHNGGNDPSTVTYDNSYLDVYEELGITLPAGNNNNSLSYKLTPLSWSESSS